VVKDRGTNAQQFKGLVVVEGRRVGLSPSSGVMAMAEKKVVHSAQEKEEKCCSKDGRSVARLIQDATRGSTCGDST
jgi:hypothetical protein